MEKAPRERRQENSKEDLTRRELFRRGGKTLAGAGAMMTLSHIEAIPGFAAEILKEGSELRKGCETMLKNVFENEKEVGGIASMKNGEWKGKWYGFTEGEMVSVNVTGETIVRALKKIAKEKGVDMILDVHTHPFSDYGEDAYEMRISLGEIELKEMKNGERPLLSMPPSTDDIERNQDLSFQLKEMYRLDPTRFFGAVFDPRGIWYYQVDLARYQEICVKREMVGKMRAILRNEVIGMPEHTVNSVFDKLQKREEGIKVNWLPSLTENDGVLNPSSSEEERKRATILSYLRGGDEELMKALTMTDEVKEALERGIRIEQEFYFLAQKFQDATQTFMIKSLKGDLTEEDYTTLSEAYTEQGSTLEFKSYQSMGLSYKNVHKQ